MNSKKIACISCVNNKNEYDEFLYYLNRQHISDEYQLEIIPITDAVSMANGYNKAMSSSDAKYKVYAHQDLFFVNPDALINAIKLFESDSTIGIIGLVGNSNLAKRGFLPMDYDRGGIDHNAYPHRLSFDSASAHPYSEVDNVDGALIITAYDLPWREDIFDGWDFYDVSQCMEFKKKGYRIVVTDLSYIHCYHDCTYSNYLNYYEYKSIFMKEYFPDVDYHLSDNGKRSLEYANIQKDTRRLIYNLAKNNERSQLIEIFKNDDFRGHAHLREFEALTSIDYLEKRTKSPRCIWAEGEDFDIAIQRLDTLRKYIKRIELNVGDDISELIKTVKNNYSVFSIFEAIEKYCVEPDSMRSRMDISLS